MQSEEKNLYSNVKCIQSNKFPTVRVHYSTLIELHELKKRMKCKSINDVIVKLIKLREQFMKTNKIRW